MIVGSVWKCRSNPVVDIQNGKTLQVPLHQPILFELPVEERTSNEQRFHEWYFPWYGYSNDYNPGLHFYDLVW